jgi:hypothetical protein
MNQHQNNILENYEKADFDQRLNMYLQFPLLRPEFNLIDQNNLETKFL